MGKKQPTLKQTLLQLTANFVLPLFVLTRMNQQLGATKALLLALAFPVVYELYNIMKNKKVSMVSLIAIGGIIVTGGLSLLHLGPTWLAVRRAVPYLFISFIILGAELLGKSLIKPVMAQVFDEDKLAKAVKAAGSSDQYASFLKKLSYLVSGMFLVVSVLSYAVTKAVVTSSADLAAFNQEYAKLRVLSIPYITLPMLMCVVLIVWYAISQVEKITKTDSEALMHTKATQK